MATAYFLKSRNFNVKILFERNIKGVLGSIKIENESFDLGYQFFDGLDKETDKFIRNMFSNNDLYDLNMVQAPILIIHFTKIMQCLIGILMEYCLRSKLLFLFK